MAQQTVAWAIQKAFLAAQRKADAPAAGTSKYEVLLDLADSMTKAWESEPGVEWDSLYSVQIIGTVSATDTFELTEEVNYISKSEDNPVRITNGTSTKAYKVVSARQLYKYKDSDVCAQIGHNLVFAKAFASDSNLIGYNIQVPAIIHVDDITSANDDIQVDDPMWLVYMMAAEFCRNDVVKQGQYDNLLAYANQCMERMKQANSGQLEELTLSPGLITGETWS